MKPPKFLSDFYWQLHGRKYYFLVAAFSILLNWAGHTFVYENSYKFLYFDTLGTFVAVIVLGSVWGMLVALATAILLSALTSPHFIYLAVVYMVAALYWGILSESGMLAVIKNKRSPLKSGLRVNFSSAVVFVLFAGVGCGLITGLFSSVIRSAVFQGPAFDQPYSLYFAGWFKSLFGVEAGTGWPAVFASYVADTFIEIPDKALSAFFGIAICLTIFKFNAKTLTDTYRDEVQSREIPWHRISLKNFNSFEILVFAALCVIYFFKIQSVSAATFGNLFMNFSVNTLRDYLFMEIILLPFFIFFVFLAVKFFMPSNADLLPDNFEINVKDNFNIKNTDKDIKSFLADAFFICAALVIVYVYIIISITGMTPMAYYRMISPVQASPETLVWLFVMLAIFILIDRKNNRMTEMLTLNDELVKRRTLERMSESFDEQRQKLQVLELNWPDNTVEFLRSARHDLVNELEKSKTGLNDLLSEVYDNVVKPYSKTILDNQKEMRSYIEEITGGKFSEYALEALEKDIEKIVEDLRGKISSYAEVRFSGLKDSKKLYCKMNRLFFVAFNNILDNSVRALQKKTLEPGFNAYLSVGLEIENEKSLIVKISDNAGGLPKDKISKIYRAPLESSKGERLGEGTMIAKNFVKLTGGYISARNIRVYGETGLETSIHIPYFKK